MRLQKSPLRYPGGKSRAVQQIASYLPTELSEYREPFVGGGSFFLYMKQHYPHIPIWINDLNPELYLFWKHTQLDSERLAQEIKSIKDSTSDGKGLFYELLLATSLNDIERATRFFILNRVTFSGVVEAGGYSQLAYQGRFTHSAIERVAKLGPLLEGVTITNLDYRATLFDGDQTTFTFLDPPYYLASKLYGKHGDLHTAFDHAAFAQAMPACHHSWLITYDDSPTIRANFSFAHIVPWELQYGMNNYKQKTARKGHELFITNLCQNR